MRNSEKDHLKNVKKKIEILNEKFTFQKPRWMLNESYNENEWLVAKNGFEIPLKPPYDTGIYFTLNFNKETCHHELLTDELNARLLTDIKNSLLYLSANDIITRTIGIKNVLISSINLINYSNEIRVKSKIPLIRKLDDISQEELTSYLQTFNINKEIFDEALIVLSAKTDENDVTDWNHLKNELKITSVELDKLKIKLTKFRKSKQNNTASHYTSEYNNASIEFFNIDKDLTAKKKTISNEIGSLEMLYRSRIAQEFQFNISPRKIFSDGSSFFESLNVNDKTKLMPVNVAFHAIESAIHFVKNYGRELRKFIKLLLKSEAIAIKELNLSPSRVSKNSRLVRNEAFKLTETPETLKKLNISCWEYDTKFEGLPQEWVRNNLSVEIAIILYVSSMWILLASFTSGRSLSLQTLKRNCFHQSPMDGLFDITLRIPKSSERQELEEVHRPIPDLIFDFGIDFSLLVTELEERRGYFFNEDEAYLFGKILSSHSLSSFINEKKSSHRSNFFKYPLSNDTIYKYLCIFQDWSRSPLIGYSRWYPSKHQFRRLFAVLYFNFTNNEGLEELSWFMGHASLEQTFHYAEISPTEDWLEEAEIAISKIGSDLRKSIYADDTIKGIVNEARNTSDVIIVLEPLIRKLISEHKKATGKEVRFNRIDEENVFFYFTNQGGKTNGKV